MKLKKIIFLCCLMCGVLPTMGQSQQDNRMVDSRVTLDDRHDTKQGNPQQPSREKPATTQHPYTSPLQKSNTPSDSTLQLPSSFNGVTVKAWLDTSSIIIGGQTTLHIRLEGVNGKNIHLPQPKELQMGPVEALALKNDTIRDDKGSIKAYEQHVSITSFETGTHRIAGIKIDIAGDGAVGAIAPADSLFLEVQYTPDADTVKCEVKEDAGMMEEPINFGDVCRIGIPTLLIALLIAAIIWIIIRRKQNKPIVVLPKPKPIPADKKAISDLEALRRKELWQKGRIKRYYTDMTDIVRRFLRNMYGISATEMTTRQTLNAFHGIADWSEDSESLLRQLLQQADMVKFAKSQPQSYEHDQAMQNAIDFIRKVAENHRINNPEKEENK